MMPGKTLSRVSGLVVALIAGAARVEFVLLAWTCLSVFTWPCAAAEANSLLTEKISATHTILGTDDWYGCRRTVFDFEGYEAWVVEPPEGVKSAAGSPWTWTMQWATAYVPRTSVPRLVKECGWRHATVITYKDKMDQHGLEVSARFQKYLVDGLGFAKKAHLIGMSWGGFYSVRYAVTYPDNVAKAYLDAPLLCFRDFDPKTETVDPRHGPWVKTAPADGKWSADPRMPLNMAERLAATGIPVFLVYGGQDKSCPPELNAVPFIARFKAAGGEKNLKVLYREFFGHHPHGVEESDNAIIDFFTRPSDPKIASETERNAAIARLKALPTTGEITGVYPTNGVTACDFTLRTGKAAAVHCHLLLPAPSKWNGRFWGIGNEGYGAQLKWWLVDQWQMPRVTEGGAACLADMGTSEGRFGMETISDFGWRAMHQMTVEAKRLVQAFYGREAEHNYFLGISSGGAQGMAEAERFPEDYEGIAVYVPANYRTAHVAMSRHLWLQCHAPDGRQVVTKEQCRALADAALAHFQTPFILSPEYDEEAAEAILGRAAKTCPELSDPDLRRRWKQIWQGPIRNGVRLPSGFGFGADLSSALVWRQFVQNARYGAKAARPLHEMTDAAFEAFLSEVEGDLDATTADLSKYLSRNAKLLLVSGLADSCVSARTAWDYCRRAAEKANGEAWFKDNFRAYFLPGREHCGRASGRDGVNDIPAVQLLVDWCEKGKTPAALTCQLKDGSPIVVRPWTYDVSVMQAPIERWEDALPLGNGQAGALVWGGGDTLRLSLDRADYWHLSVNTVFDNPAFNWTNLIVYASRDVEDRKRIFEGRVGDSSKLPGVRLEMKFGDGVKISSFRLDMKRAEACVELNQGGVKKTLRAWFVSGDPLLHVAVPAGVTVAASEFVRNAAFDRLGGYPEPTIERTADAIVYTRGNRCSGEWAKGFTAGVRFVPADAASDLAWWKDFYAHSSVSVPDERIQRLYDFAMYLYGSGSRNGFAPIALQGVWTADDGELPPWHGDYHHDLNSQMTYWASPVAGHFDSHDAFATYMCQLTPSFESFAKRFFGLDRGMVIPGAMGYDGSWIAGKSQYAIPPSNGLWAFSVFFDGWNYSPTRERLDAIYPFGVALADAAEQLLLPPDENGVRRWPISTSPEFGEGDTSAWYPPNSNYDRSILIGFFSQMATLAKAKGDAVAERKYREFSESFGPAVLSDEGRYLLAKGRDLTDSHRHISHLLDVFPYCRIADGSDARKSLDHFEALGTKEWIGFTPVWAAAMEARLGAGDRVLGYLRVFADKFVSRSGLHLNGDQTKSGYSNFTYHPFTLEANFCFARAVQEMLIGSYEDGVRVFPAVPTEWRGRGVSFANLRVPGGHRVSATLSPDGTVHGSVTGFSDGELKLVLPCGKALPVALRKDVPARF